MYQIRKGEGTFTNYKENFQINAMHTVFIFILYYFHSVPIVNNLPNFISATTKFHMKRYSIPFTISKQCACLNMLNDNEGNNI